MAYSRNRSTIARPQPLHADRPPPPPGFDRGFADPGSTPPEPPSDFAVVDSLIANVSSAAAAPMTREQALSL